MGLTDRGSEKEKPVNGMHRRHFLRQTLTTGALAGVGDLAFLSGLRPVSAQEAQLDTQAVQLRPEIEPLVRLLEETPRERLLEQIAARIHQGLTYREILAALLLAGVRNVQPRPSVGFKFHAVLVVNSAHLASLAVARLGPLAADLLGAGLFQEFAAARRGGRKLDDAAGGRGRSSRRR